MSVQTNDPVLSAIRDARRREKEAEREIRHLIAFARNCVVPRPYTLASLAEASERSISGVRTMYGDEELRAIGAVPTNPHRS